jgi:hypothetical protein
MIIAFDGDIYLNRLPALIGVRDPLIQPGIATKLYAATQ